MTESTIENGASGSGAPAAENTGAGGAAAAGQGVGQGQGATGAPAGAGGESGNVFDGATPAASPSAAPAVGIPEKFHVLKDGALDVDASSKKLAEAYSNLEKRIGTGEIPPKSAADYVVSVPDVLKEHWNPAEDPEVKDFLQEAHKAGYTQKQIDLAMTKYMDAAMKIATSSAVLDKDEAVKELRHTWQTEAEFNDNVNHAQRVIRAYAGKDADGLAQSYGNDPRFVRMMAAIGREYGNDSPPSVETVGAPAFNVVQVMRSDAYTNPKNPDHERITAQVRQHFQQQEAIRARTQGAVI
jgi:hypothetical protein